ncbi:MAG: NAD(P)H-dependent oxidoreductase [Nanoarchaeota archaeon]|nr:NAD(P)H-dependent oxidoreductase [Nanoarchaeota archaeon]
MKIGIIIGSHRSESQSSKVGKYIKKELVKLYSNTASFYTLDLRNNPLPLWREEKWQPESDMQKLWEPYSEELKTCDGFIVISPEWGGMVPSGLKNFFLLCESQELAHKPALLVSISAGINGVYPISELRMSSYKNTYISYLPSHIIVRNVGDVLNEEESINERDKSIREKIWYELNIFTHYVKAYKKIRQEGEFDFKKYPFGM